MMSKSTLIISSYTISKLRRFFETQCNSSEMKLRLRRHPYDVRRVVYDPTKRSFILRCLYKQKSVLMYFLYYCSYLKFIVVRGCLMFGLKQRSTNPQTFSSGTAGEEDPRITRKYPLNATTSCSSNIHTKPALEEMLLSVEAWLNERFDCQ